MNVNDIELDVLLDVLLAHWVRTEDGQEAAGDKEILKALIEKLSDEWDRRVQVPLERAELVADAIGEGESTDTRVVDPYDLSKYINMGEN
jgi:hypothetical protein